MVDKKWIFVQMQGRVVRASIHPINVEDIMIQYQALSVNG